MLVNTGPDVVARHGSERVKVSHAVIIFPEALGHNCFCANLFFRDLNFFHIYRKGPQCGRNARDDAEICAAFDFTSRLHPTL